MSSKHRPGLNCNFPSSGFSELIRNSLLPSAGARRELKDPVQTMCMSSNRACRVCVIVWPHSGNDLAPGLLGRLWCVCLHPAWLQDSHHTMGHWRVAGLSSQQRHCSDSLHTEPPAKPSMAPEVISLPCCSVAQWQFPQKGFRE